MNFKECPKCSGKQIEVGIVLQRFVTLNNGKKIKEYIRDADAGYTRCLKCGYEESVGTQNGKGYQPNIQLKKEYEEASK